MIQKIIDFSIHDRLLILIATAIVAAVGLWTMKNTPLDAIPDLSDVQVIIFTQYSGQAPQVVEDQVTYPLTTAMLQVPKSKVVRGYSFFGISFVYIIFEDGTDMYWARSRVLESLNYVGSSLPAGVTPSLGPDATGVAWIYEYASDGTASTLSRVPAWMVISANMPGFSLPSLLSKTNRTLTVRVVPSS